VARAAGQADRAVRRGLDARRGHAADRRSSAAKARAEFRWSRTSRARAAISAPTRSPRPSPTAYTIGLSIGGPLGINPILFGKLPYDPQKDLALVTMLTTQPSALAVNASLGVDTVAELIDLLKKNPGKYNYGSIGNGSLSHLAMEAIALKSGTQMVHIPYGGSPQAMTALIRNDVQMACLPAISVTPHLASGQVKILAITTAARLRAAARHCDPQGSGRRRRGRRLERPDRAGQDAGTDHRTPAQRRDRSAHRARHTRKARRADHGADPDHVGAIPRPHRGGRGALDAGDQGGKYQGELRRGGEHRACAVRLAQQIPADRLSACLLYIGRPLA